MFTIEKRTAKNGNVYIGLFPNGGKCPVVVNDYHVLCPLLGVTFEELADIRKTNDKALNVRFEEKA